jgi:cob(I)alamin adenosyltransferase
VKERSESNRKKGLTAVFTGDGKGKTSAALGIALRAAGYGMRTCFIQFIKGDMYSGEIESIQRLFPEVELWRTGKGFVKGPDDPDYEIHRKAAAEALELAKEKIMSQDYDVVVLDEINGAIGLGLVPLSDVIHLIDNKPKPLHLILTGRNTAQAIIAKADMVTEMLDIKHPFNNGEGPRKGIDY